MAIYNGTVYQGGNGRSVYQKGSAYKHFEVTEKIVPVGISPEREIEFKEAIKAMENMIGIKSENGQDDSLDEGLIRLLSSSIKPMVSMTSTSERLARLDSEDKVATKVSYGGYVRRTLHVDDEAKSDVPHWSRAWNERENKYEQVKTDERAWNSNKQRYESLEPKEATSLWGAFPSLSSLNPPLLNTMSVGEFCKISLDNTALTIRTYMSENDKRVPILIPVYYKVSKVGPSSSMFLLIVDKPSAPKGLLDQWPDGCTGTSRIILSGTKESMCHFDDSDKGKKLFMDKVIRSGHFVFRRLLGPR